jgi:hypothetical protein
MLRNLTTFGVLAAFGLMMCFSAGCENEAQSKALLGAGLGVGISAISGGEGSNLATGAAIGAGVGYLWGNEEDKKKAQQEGAYSTGTAPSGNTQSVWITNSNGSKTEVKLTRKGSSYIGPKGESYPTMPTKEQLKQVYGF